MSEMALADEELVQRLNALPIDQRNAILQNVLNNIHNMMYTV